MGVAEAFGCKGVRVDTMEALTSAISEACEAQGDGVTPDHVIDQIATQVALT